MEEASYYVLGASIVEVKEHSEIREKVQEVAKTGVEFSTCIVCAEEYEAVESLEAIGIEANHTGELLTLALQDETWSVLTI